MYLLIRIYYGNCMFNPKFILILATEAGTKTVTHQFPDA